MKKLILSALVVMGLALAQAPYVGGHVGLIGGPVPGDLSWVPFLRGQSWVHFLNGGIHVGVGLRDGLERRVGVDFTSVPGLVVPGINVDLLMNLSTPGSPVLPYVGLGGDIWLIPLAIPFGVHATLGIKYPISGISGTRETLFLEVQPGFAFAFVFPIPFVFPDYSVVSAFGYRLKVGVNSSF